MNKYQEALDNLVKVSCPKKVSCTECDINIICNCIAKEYVDTLQELINKAIKDKKLRAKEMFENLGFYKRVHNNGNIIEWRHKEIHFMISFYKHDKDYAVFGYCYINLEIHKAIHQQCKELGWI